MNLSNVLTTPPPGGFFLSQFSLAFPKLLKYYHVAVKFSVGGKEITVRENLNQPPACYLKLISRSSKEEKLQMEVAIIEIKVLGEIEEIPNKHDTKKQRQQQQQ